MIKKKSNSQSIIIIVLSILLVVSIAFGVTYSVYNGKTNLVKGTITTANLAIELHDKSGKTTEFSISAPFGEEYLIPGNNLNNIELNLFNKSSRKTYLVVLYTLSATKISTGEDVTNELKNTPAISFRENAINTNVWQPISYECKNTSATYTCLVGINEFNGRGDTSGYYINVLPTNAIKIPAAEWGPTLMDCNVTISVLAYAIQSENLERDYLEPIFHAQQAGNMVEKAQAVATAVLQICGVDAAAND